jgi:hypothetical protein
VRKRTAEGGVPMGQHLEADGFGFAAEFPMLFEHLASNTFDDGASRQTSSILLFCQGGVWKACLHDRQEGECLWVSGATYGDLLAAVEAALAAPTADWRPDSRRGKK